MYKRRFTFVLICLLSFAAASQNLSAQSQLAQDTYAIFEASCLNCHGPDGAFRETLLMDHSELIDGGTVVSGNPNASELYKRLLGPTENGAQMPFGLPQLPPQSIDTVRRWILAGAPAWTTTRITDGRFIYPAEILDTIETHLNSLSSFDRAFARYFTLTHLYNAGETAEILGEYRKALNKLVNSLSWGIAVTNPQPIDSLDTIFYIDLRHYEWDRIDAWTKIEGVYPYHVSFDAPTQTSLHDQLGRLQTQMKCDVPSVHIDWFIATASTPPLYHELLSLPPTARELELQLNVDVVGNLQNAPGVRVWRAGFNNSGVSNHNRVVERHTSRYGAYWKSYDFAGSVGTQNILTHPLNFTHDGGEIIFNLPNGLQGYYLVDGNGIRLDEAPISIVSNPAASDPTVRNGLSCIGCHTEGMKTFDDQVRAAIESNPSPPYNKAQALRLYVEQSVMDVRVSEDMETYRVALEATGDAFGGVEPVSRFHEAFHAPVDAAYAAAVVGLETETFLERVRENTGLQNVGLLALDNPNGSVKRDTWTSSFRDIISALDYPQQVGESPVITQPDVIPGTVVQIPDPNLRALIAEMLDKSVNEPITVAEMKRLRDLNPCARSCNLGIRDLTGVQFATNLVYINLSHNQVTDISPLAGLIELRNLYITDNLVSDISPVSGLTNLAHLSVADCRNLSDISPVRNLTNLTHLWLDRTQVSDLSPLAGLTNLTWLDITKIDYVFSESAIHTGDIFTIDVRAEAIIDLAGWQFDIAFDPALLEAVSVSEGDFLKTDGGSTFFQKGLIDNGSGKITGLSVALLGDRGASGSGDILHVQFKAKSGGNTEIALRNFQFGSIHGKEITTGPHEITFTVEERLGTGDVNRDGVVSVLDLILVARQLGRNVPANSPVDINGDGVVNIFDLTLVAQGIGGAAAPAVSTGRADAATVEAWIAEARLADDGSIAFAQGIQNLENLLASYIPKETALLANYPNPFNPETWIPYQLAAPAEVKLTIYDMNGGVVRRLEVGHQAAGIYQSRNRALYWDGRNDHGEFVASGLYFYTLRAGEFGATRKMLIRK